MAFNITSNYIKVDTDTGYVYHPSLPELSAYVSTYDSVLAELGETSLPCASHTSLIVGGDDDGNTLFMNFGGNLGKLSLQVGQIEKDTGIIISNSISTMELEVPDFSWYGTFKNNLYFVGGGFPMMIENGNHIHYFGGRIVGQDASDNIINMPLGNAYTLHMGYGEMEWSTSTPFLDSESNRLDFSYVNWANTDPNNPVLSGDVYCAGVGKFTDVDPETITYTSLYKVSLDTLDNATNPIITELEITDLESINVLPLLVGGKAFYNSSNTTVYFQTSGKYTALDSSERSFAILKYNTTTGVSSVILGDLVTKYMPSKRFVMTGAACFAGTGPLSGKILFYGSLSPDKTSSRDTMLTYNMANDQFVVNKVNSDISIPVSVINATHDEAIPAYKDYYVMKAAPTYANTNLILGGMDIAA